MKPKYLTYSLTITIMTIFSANLCYAILPADVPRPQTYENKFISDSANIIDTVQEKQLDDFLQQHERETGNQIAVVTVTDTKGTASPKQFATELFQQWGIGDKELDNGLLIFVSIGDRRIEFETGYGLEAILPDVYQGRIQRSFMIPKFKAGDYQSGILDGTYATVKAINVRLQEEEAYQKAHSNNQTIVNETSETTQLKELSLVDTMHEDSTASAGFLEFLFKLFLALTLPSFALIGLLKIFRRNSKNIKNNQDSQPSEAHERTEKVNIIDTRDTRLCHYCNELTEYKDTALNNHEQDVLLSKYEKALLKNNLADVLASNCLSCGQKTIHVSLKQELLVCSNCNLSYNKTGFVLINTKFSMKRYLYVYQCKPTSEALARLATEKYRYFPDYALIDSTVKIYAKACFICGLVEEQEIRFNFKFPPLPKPKVIAIEDDEIKAKNRTKNKKDDDEDWWLSKSSSYSSSRSSRSYSSSNGSSWDSSSRDSSSRGSSGSSWNSDSSGFGGGSSGGGGAGSDW